jgi:murein DD-endopeptidase MepM/ murein hydrolase activator NlpD
MTVITLGFFYQIFASSKLPVFVLPFNIITLIIIYSLKFRKDHTDLTLLYFKPGSPEENYYYHHNQKARFEKFKYFSAELPFFGEWKVSQGFNGSFTHKDQWKYAWDFVVVDENNKEFRNDGLKLEDYYCYDLPVISPLDGEVVKIINKIMDNPVGEINIDKNWGNTIIIKHSDDFFSAISHLKEGSFKVKVGDKVKKGTVLARCGNSGRSPYPHIHFQFQLTDKIGEKTFKYPIGNYISNLNGKKELNIFDFLKEGSLVKNLETHKTIKNSFDFKLGNKFNFKYEQQNKLIEEEWEVKVDIYNLLYFENNFGEIAYFTLTDKIFYFTSYIGKKNSALYYFYLTTPVIPFTFDRELVWKTSYSLREVNNSKLLYINELLLLFKNFLSSYGSISIYESEEFKNSFIINTEIQTNGRSLLVFFKNSKLGKVKIDDLGNLSEIVFFDKNKLIFKANRKKME